MPTAGKVNFTSALHFLHIASDSGPFMSFPSTMKQHGGGGFFFSLIGISTGLAGGNSGTSVGANSGTSVGSQGLLNLKVLPLFLVPDTNAGEFFRVMGVEGTEALELGVELMALKDCHYCNKSNDGDVLLCIASCATSTSYLNVLLCSTSYCVSTQDVLLID